LPVTGMSFRKDDKELLSVSADRSIVFTPIRQRPPLLFWILTVVIAAELFYILFR
jgi:hypothetical protein